MTQPDNERPAPSNKRRNGRKTPKGSTRVRAYRNPLGLGPNIAVSVLDLSESGARLLLNEALPTGNEFALKIECVGGKSVKVVAEVVWGIATAEGQFVVGARFHKSISYADLHALARI